MNRQQGLTVVSLLWVLVITGTLLAISVPALLRYGERIEAQTTLVSAVQETLASMELALARHWSAAQCRTAPGITLQTLIAEHDLSSSVMQLGWGLTPDYPHANQMRLRITASSVEDSQLAMRALAKKPWQVKQEGNTVVVTANVPEITTYWQHVNRRPGEACFVN